MELKFLILSLPAIVALTFKIAIWLYAGRSEIQSPQTRIFLFLLFALATNNVTEIFVFYDGRNGAIPSIPAYAYFVTGIAALAVFVHFAMRLGLEFERIRHRHWLLVGVYGYAGILEVLLLATPLLVTGFAPLGFSYYRIPGRLYFLFEIYAIASFILVIALLAFGSIRYHARALRIRCQFMLFGLLPVASLVITNIMLMHFNIDWLNTPIVLPLSTTFFLVVTTYAVHQYRLLDIQFYLPWSKIRKRKTAFYNRVRDLISEIADLRSSEEAISRLSTTLGCPVALVSSDRPIIAAAGSPHSMVEIPTKTLRKIDHITVANEIIDVRPELFQSMAHHGVAAVVPFHPRSQHAAGWLLLGESFSEQVYTKLDFKLVEQLFEKMADLFLDKLLTMRTQLAEASRSIRQLQNQRQELTESLTALQEQSQLLHRQNELLRRERPIDSLASFTTVGSGALISSERFAAAITLLGRDKATLKHLRLKFSQIQNYVNIDSAGFRNQVLPEVLIILIDHGEAKANAKLAEFLRQGRERTAILLYGPAARDFAVANRSALLGGLIEVLPEQHTYEMLVRKVRALAALRQAVYAISDTEQPLVGQSQVFIDQIATARQLAGFSEPLLLKTSDLHQALALAAHVHASSGRQGPLRILRPEQIIGNESDLAVVVDEARKGSLVIPQIGQFSAELRVKLLDALASVKDVRLIAICDATASEDRGRLLQGFRPFIIEMPGLRERKIDVALLIHYFTLQFNLQGGTDLYLSQSEADGLLESAYPENVADLKRMVFTQLSFRLRRPSDAPCVQAPAPIGDERTDKTLDDCIAEFEARIITQTLERCGGNKSKAARLLGLRPNTLHYKLERYGIGKNS
ncbi:MAG: helix-turn-helix domain-containing protein [Acidiferrobacterales bacterium]